MELLRPNGDPVKIGDLEEYGEYSMQFENGKIYIIDLIQEPTSNMNKNKANRILNKQMSDLAQDAASKLLAGPDKGRG